MYLGEHTVAQLLLLFLTFVYALHGAHTLTRDRGKLKQCCVPTQQYFTETGAQTGNGSGACLVKEMMNCDVKLLQYNIKMLLGQNTF